MIKCDRCEKYLDEEEDGIDGIYSPDYPFVYLCPLCVELLSEVSGADEPDAQEIFKTHYENSRTHCAR